jgi:hypothetical protein
MAQSVWHQCYLDASEISQVAEYGDFINSIRFQLSTTDPAREVTVYLSQKLAETLHVGDIFVRYISACFASSITAFSVYRAHFLSLTSLVYRVKTIDSVEFDTMWRKYRLEFASLISPDDISIDQLDFFEILSDGVLRVTRIYTANENDAMMRTSTKSLRIRTIISTKDKMKTQVTNALSYSGINFASEVQKNTFRMKVGCDLFRLFCIGSFNQTCIVIFCLIDGLYVVIFQKQKIVTGVFVFIFVLCVFLCVCVYVVVFGVSGCDRLASAVCDFFCDEPR